MKLHFLVHAPFEKPGTIQTWADSRGYTYHYTHTYRGERLPKVNDFDFLVIMGGPQSSLKLDKYPYLHNEVALIGQAIADNKHVLGVCLGAQLISIALGAKPERSPEKEIGFFPITLTAAGESDRIFKQFPTTFGVMHWHYDMPGIAEGAKILAASEGCPRQIFSWGKRCYGLQCHLELTRDFTQALLNKLREDLQPSVYTQSANVMLAVDFATLSKRMHLFLDELIRV